MTQQVGKGPRRLAINVPRSRKRKTAARGECGRPSSRPHQHLCIWRCRRRDLILVWRLDSFVGAFLDVLGVV